VTSPVRAAPVAAGAGMIALALAALLALGRTPVYQRGPVRVWSGDVGSDQNSQQLSDPYTFTHITHGIAFYALVRVLAPRASLASRALAALAIECAWEVIENTDAVIERYRTATMAQGYYGDSVLNSFGDILATLVGFALAASLPTPLTVIVTAALEAGLALWIRDGLLLNILMLVWPVERIRVWQQGGP
jgi:hypothetical protein